MKKKVTTALGFAILACSSVNTHAAKLSEVLAKDPQFSILAQAVKTAGLTAAIEDLKDATVFAPTNNAFENLSVTAYRNLLADKDALKNLLLDHVVMGSFSERELSQVMLTSLRGTRLIASGVFLGYDQFIYAEIGIDCNSDGALDRVERAFTSAQITTPNVRLENNVTVQILDQLQPRDLYPVQLTSKQFIDGKRCP